MTLIPILGILWPLFGMITAGVMYVSEKSEKYNMDYEDEPVKMYVIAICLGPILCGCMIFFLIQDLLNNGT